MVKGALKIIDDSKSLFLFVFLPIFDTVNKNGL